jgi:hypothetical protein
MTKQAKRKTRSGSVKGAEAFSARDPQLLISALGPLRILYVPMYPAPLALRHVLRLVEKNSCDGSIKHDLGRNANTCRIVYFYKAVARIVSSCAYTVLKSLGNRVLDRDI